jgi:hypothetical protein
MGNLLLIKNGALLLQPNTGAVKPTIYFWQENVLLYSNKNK